MNRTRAVFSIIILASLLIVAAGLIYQLINEKDADDNSSLAVSTPLPATGSKR